MGLYRYFPTPCERMGTLWTLMPIEGAAILEFGPGGTTHYSMEGYFMLGADMRANLYTTHIDENDIAMGSTERIEQAVREIVAKHKPAYLFVMASSISAAIGTDLAAVCHQLQPECGDTQLIAVTGGGFRGDWTQGVEATLTMLVDRIAREARPVESVFNLIGSCVDAHNYTADALEIARLMEGCFGLKLGAALTSPSATIDQIASMGNARINLVVRPEGESAAALLQKRFGTTSVTGRPYGLKGTRAWIERVGQALGQAPDADFLAAEEASLSDPMRTLAMSARRRKIPVMIGGHVATVSGISAFLRDELGFQIAGCWCNAPGLAAPDIPFYDECEWEKAVSDFHRGVLLADGVALELLPPDSVGIQIAQPNLKQHLLYPYTPWLGFRGALYLIERLTNALSELGDA